MTWAATTEVPWTVDALVAISFSPGDARRPAPLLPLAEAGLLLEVERVRRGSQLHLPARLGGVQRPDSNDRTP